MSITSVDEVWSGDDSGWQADGDGGGSASAKRKFHIIVDNVGGADSSVNVASSGLLPQQNDGHPYNYYLLCNGTQVTRISPIMFEATSTYTSPTANTRDSPLAQPAVITFGTTKEDGEVDEDINGTPIATVNGEAFEGVTMPFSDLTASITANVPAFNPLTVYVFANTVNSQTFMGFAAGVCRCSNIRAGSAMAGNFPFWKVTYDFQFRYPTWTTAERAWWKRLRHQGFIVRKTDASANLGYTLGHSFSQDGGGGTPKPVQIKPAGFDDEGYEETDAEIAYWVEFPVMRTTNFNSLGLNV